MRPPVNLSINGRGTRYVGLFDLARHVIKHYFGYLRLEIGNALYTRPATAAALNDQRGKKDLFGRFLIQLP